MSVLYLIIDIFQWLVLNKPQNKAMHRYKGNL